MIKTSPSPAGAAPTGPATAPSATPGPLDPAHRVGDPDPDYPRIGQKEPMSTRTKILAGLAISVVVLMLCLVIAKKMSKEEPQAAITSTQAIQPKEPAKKPSAESQQLESIPEPSTESPPRSLAEMIAEEDRKELIRARAELAALKEQVRKITSIERSTVKPIDVAAPQPAATIQGKRNLENEMDEQKEGLSKIDNGIAKQLVPDAKREISSLWERIQESEKVANQKFVHVAKTPTQTQTTTSTQPATLPTASKASVSGNRPTHIDGWSITYVAVGTESRKYSQQEYWNNKVRWNGHEGINFLGEKSDGTWVLLESPVSKSKMVSAGILFLKLVPQLREVEVYEAPLLPYSL